MGARGAAGDGASRARGETAELRVVMVCPYDLSRPGGVQGQATGLARALRRSGHDVVVVAPGSRPRGWATPDVYVAGRSVGVRANGSLAPVSLSVAAGARAWRAAAVWCPDVVHLHEPLAPVLGYGFLASRRWPMVGTFHRAGAGALYRLASPVARAAARRVDVRCAVSAVARDTAAAVCGGTYEVLFNGVDLDRHGSARATGTDVPAVLFLGRHEPRKGLGVLLEAFSRLERPAVLWVAGAGPETARLRARHPESPRVHWLGVVSDGEVASRLAGASVLCAPSLGGESFGMVLVEAMAARCRVVASDIDGYREVAGGHALLVPPGDAGALAAALDRALGGPPDAAALDEAAAHAAGWSMDALAARYVDLYRSVIAARDRPRAAVT